MFKANKGNTKTRSEICLKLTKKKPNQRQWRCIVDSIAKMQSIFYLIGRNSVPISDIFNYHYTKIKGLWNAQKIGKKYETFEFTLKVDQHIIVLDLCSILIKKIIWILTEFLNLNISQNLNSLQKESTQWNQQFNGCMLSKVTECLEKSNTQINAKQSNTNGLQKTIDRKKNK